MVDGNTLLVGTSVTGDRDLDRSRVFQQPGHRELAILRLWVKFLGLSPNTAYKIKLTFTAPDETTFETECEVVTDPQGEAQHKIEVDDKFIHPTLTDVCNGCTLDVEEVECPAPGCEVDINAMVSPVEKYSQL